MLRSDISIAINQTPPTTQQTIMNHASTALALVNANLPPEEKVYLISSACPKLFDSPALTSLLLITGQRLLFIAPMPQAISWPLASITDSDVVEIGQSMKGFYVDGNGTSVQLGIDSNWGPTFGMYVKQACAVAILRNSQQIS